MSNNDSLETIISKVGGVLGGVAGASLLGYALASDFETMMRYGSTLSYLSAAADVVIAPIILAYGYKFGNMLTKGVLNEANSIMRS